MAGRRGNFNPLNRGGRGNAIPNMVRPSIPSLSVDKPVSSPQVVNPDSLFSDPGMGGGQMREIMNILPQLPPEKIKQFIPQLPPEVIKQVAPQLPPEIIREIAPSLPPEIIREVIPQLPPEIIREVIPQLPIEVMQEVIPQLPPEIAQQVAPPEVLEAVRVRKDANDAKSSATDQYEADVADFKNTQATEAEQGIASLPEVSTLSQGQIVPEGLGSFVPPQQGGPQFGGIPAEGFGPKPQFDPDSLFSDPNMGGGEPPFQGRRPQEGPFAPPPPPPMGGPDFNPFMGGNTPIPNLPPDFDPDSLFSDPNLGGGEPPFQGRRRFEPPVVEEPFTPPPMGGPDFNPFMGGGEEPYMPPGSPIDLAEPPFQPPFQGRRPQEGSPPPFMGGGPPPVLEEGPPPPTGGGFPSGGPDFNPFPGGGDFSGIDFGDFGDFIDFVPPQVDLGTGESSDNTGTVPPPLGGRRGGFPGRGGFPPFLPWDPDNPNEGPDPFDPNIPDGGPLPPAPPGGGLPPGGEPLPQPPEPPPYDGPVNPYTGEFVQDPYQPYATDSGATPLVRKMTPEQFGQAPGMGPPLRTMPYPQRPFPMPPPMPPMDSIGYPEQRLGMFNGGYLNNGISQLPTNQQGDTLTQQVFQSGFRPRS
tara:strand:+ start:5414 stop:7324 length:1911 start_codon:yes stop_codon:yes gene_type:complete